MSLGDCSRHERTLAAINQARGKCLAVASDSHLQTRTQEGEISSPTSFWKTLAGLVDAGKVVSPRRVYQELTENEKHQDYVKAFVSPRKKQLCQPSNKEIGELVGQIELHIFSFQQYDHGECWRFSKGGDPWVIAHAIVDKGIVISQESHLHPQAKKPLGNL